MQNHYRQIDTQVPVLVNQAAPSYVTIPAFLYNNGESEFSTLLAEAELGNETPTTISLPLPVELTDNITFALAIRFTLNGNTTRFVLHKPQEFDGVLYATYTGQAIHPDAVFEIWANSAFSEARSTVPLSIQLGEYTPRGSAVASHGGIIASVNTTLTLTPL